MNMSYLSIDQVETGKRIRELRKERGLKVTDISEYMGFESPQAVYKWQRGDCLPDLENLIRLLNLFGIQNIREIIVVSGDGDEPSPCDYLEYRCS